MLKLTIKYSNSIFVAKKISLDDSSTPVHLAAFHVNWTPSVRQEISGAPKIVTVSTTNANENPIPFSSISHYSRMYSRRNFSY